MITIQTRRPLLVLGILTAFAASGCGDYSIRLPGGYSLVSVYSGAVLISHPEKGVVIDANIDRYCVIGEIVVGDVITAELAPEKNFSKPGYFILNTTTHELKQALDKKAWLESLQELGINDEPTLHKPSRFDKDYPAQSPSSQPRRNNDRERRGHDGDTMNRKDLGVSLHAQSPSS